MKEKVGRSQRTGSVMDCTDFVVLAFLFAACGTTLVFAQGGKDLNGECRTVKECNSIGYLCARNRTCQCVWGYVPNESWTMCVGFVGSKCFYDRQCVEGAYCTGAEGAEKCKCRVLENFHVNEDGQTCSNAAFGRQLSSSVLLVMVATSLYFNT